MFDIGFWELLLIGAVGLLVIGPERLPAVATLVGQWIGRIRRYARHMQSEIRDELESEHLKQVLDQQNREMQSLREEMGDARRQADELLNESARADGGNARREPNAPEHGEQRDKGNDD